VVLAVLPTPGPAVTATCADLTPPPVRVTPVEIANLLLVPVAVIIPAEAVMLEPSTLGPPRAVMLARGSVAQARVPVMSLVESVWAVMEHVYGPTTPDSFLCDYDPTEPQVYLRLTPEQHRRLMS
jgi:hypothetical protein